MLLIFISKYRIWRYRDQNWRYGHIKILYKGKTIPSSPVLSACYDEDLHFVVKTVRNTDLKTVYSEVVCTTNTPVSGDSVRLTPAPTFLCCLLLCYPMGTWKLKKNPKLEDHPLTCTGCCFCCTLHDLLLEKAFTWITSLTVLKPPGTLPRENIFYANHTCILTNIHVI